MTQPITTEIIARVYDDDTGDYLEASLGDEGLGIRLKTSENFGLMNIQMTKELAKAFAEAILKVIEVNKE